MALGDWGLAAWQEIKEKEERLKRVPLGEKYVVTCWVVVSNIFYFHPYLGKISILTNIFQRG